MENKTFIQDLKSGKLAGMIKESVKGDSLRDSKEIYNIMKPLMASYDDIEVCFFIFLDSQNRIIAIEKLFEGTISHSSVYPREIIKKLLKLKAASAVMIHNHPSGITKPSEQDYSITKIVQLAFLSIGARLLDHMVIGDGYYSMADHGFMIRIENEYQALTKH